MAVIDRLQDLPIAVEGHSGAVKASEPKPVRAKKQVEDLETGAKPISPLLQLVRLQFNF